MFVIMNTPTIYQIRVFPHTSARHQESDVPGEVVYLPKPVRTPLMRMSRQRIEPVNDAGKVQENAILGPILGVSIMAFVAASLYW